MSSEKRMLYHPIDTLKAVHEDIWVADGTVVRMSALGTSFPFSTRMTVVRLGSGELWCHSPVELTPRLQAELDQLGPVRHLVSPNKLHYAFIDDWAQAYPNATTWASPGVRERAWTQAIAVSFSEDLADSPPPQWSDDLDQLVFRGSRLLEEVVFFHRKSRTLVLADLIENFEPDKMPGRFRWLAKLGGCCDPDGKAPLDLRLTFWRNKAEARRCLESMFRWNPERVILAHGRWYEHNGADELQRAFRWLTH